MSKNPNGFGSVSKLSGNRRRPYWVKKTIGWNEKGHPIYETIGYTATKEEGLILLAEYNKNPWDIDGSKMTLEKLHTEWLEKKGVKLGKASQQSLKTAYNYTKPLWSMKYKDIKSFHMQECIDTCGKSYAVQGAIKNLFGHLDRFALEIDLINKSYSQLISAAPIPETSKEPFTSKEVDLLWENKDEPFVDVVLIYIYTGFRLSELLKMKCESVNLEEKIMTGGVKTKSGKGRIVPIHSKIFPLIKRRFDEGNEYLITTKGKPIQKVNFYNYWNDVMEKFEMKHTPHETRHTFRSKMDSANANKRCIDLIMGHKSKEVGERVYTHKTLDELRYAVELIN